MWNNKFWGNEGIVRQLQGMIRADRLPHGILLEGERGLGKKTLAGILACAAVCESAGLRPCGGCPACRKAAAGIHPDILRPQRKQTTGSIGADAIRELRSSAFVPPNEGQRKVFLLEDADDMTPQAQNILLKTLEEPPEYVILILTADSRKNLLDTVLSRVISFRLHPLGADTLAEFLRLARPDIVPEERSRAAALSGGNPGRALALLDGGSQRQMIESAQEFLGTLARRKEANALKTVSSLGKDRAAVLEWADALQTLMVSALRSVSAPQNSDSEIFGRLTGLDAGDLSRLLDIAETFRQRAEANANLTLLYCWMTAACFDALDRL